MSLGVAAGSCVAQPFRAARRPSAGLKACAAAAAALVFVAATAAERASLVDAAKNGDTDAVRALIQKRVDVNVADGDGTTALHWASYRDDVEGVELLIRAGAKVNAANDLGATPLWIA